MTCSTSVWVYPASLSYHARTLTRFPSTTRVMERSAMEAYRAPIISLDTSSSSVAANMPFQRRSVAAFLKMSFTSSAVVGRFAIKVTSAIDPAATGTRSEMPSNFPERDGYALVTAIAAPVEVGTMFCAAALPSRMSFFGPSTMDWLAVYACVVESTAFSMPIVSSRMAMTGLAELVVQEAFEVMGQVLSFSSSRPMSMVAPNGDSSFTGAVMTTRRAPASRCALAFSYSVKKPVLSTTTSIFKSFQGSFVGSFSERNCTGSLSMTSVLPATDIENGARLYTVSYLRRYARFSMEPRSFTATISISGLLYASRTKALPMRPKPLMATRIILYIRNG